MSIMTGNMIAMFAALGVMAAAGILCVVFMALWIYNDAKERGVENPAIWVALGILAPNFIGLIIYLVVRSANGRKRACPQCGYMAAESQGFCPRCGAQQPPLTQTPPPKGKAGKQLRNFLISLGAFVVTLIALIVLVVTMTLASGRGAGGVADAVGYNYSAVSITTDMRGIDVEKRTSDGVTDFTFAEFDGEERLTRFTLGGETVVSADVELEVSWGALRLELRGGGQAIALERGAQTLTLGPGDYELYAVGEEAGGGKVRIELS